MKQRIRQLRKKLGLTQAKFGQRIGVAGNTVTGWENGIRTPKEQTLISISREFRANIDWLKTGQGEMFLPVSGGTLDDLAAEYGLSSLEKEVVAEFLKLGSADRKELVTLLRRVFAPDAAKPDTEAEE